MFDSTNLNGIEAGLKTVTKAQPMINSTSAVAAGVAPAEFGPEIDNPVRQSGGRGKLMGGVAGVRPADVVIIGAGIVGTNAAQVALGMGAHVILIDINLDRLRYLHDHVLDDIFAVQDDIAQSVVTELRGRLLGEAEDEVYLGILGACAAGDALTSFTRLQDLLDGTSLDCNGTSVPDECESMAGGDFDVDGDVDLAEEGALAQLGDWKSKSDLVRRDEPVHGCTGL